MIKELDCVALAADLPEHGLAVGDVGAVVHVYEGGRSYQVEFTTPAPLSRQSADHLGWLRMARREHLPALLQPGRGNGRLR